MDTPTADTPRLHAAFSALSDDLAREIVGQAGLIERLLIALLADGHLLVIRNDAHTRAPRGNG